MANKIFRGDALVVQDLWTFTPGGTIEANDIFNTISNTKTVAATNLGGTSVALACTAIYNAVTASTGGEFTAMTWVDNATTVTATGPADGTPSVFTVTTTETGGGAADAQTYTATNTTAALSPNDWNIAGNWSASGVPGADTIFLQNSTVSIKWGLDQSAVSATALNVLASYIGDIGLPVTNEIGGYYEYRNTYLTFNDVTTLNIGFGPGLGSSRIKINTGTNAACTANVYKTGTRKENGVPALLLKGVHPSNALNVYRGDVGLAFLPGETATWTTIKIGFTESPSSDSQVYGGSGLTWTTITKTAGTLTLNSGGTTFTQNGGDDNAGNGGETDVFGASSITTLTVDKGVLRHWGTGTITTAKIGPDGVIDLSEGTGALTFTNTTMEPGSKLIDPKARVTHTNAIAVITTESNPVIIVKGIRYNIQYS